MTETLTDRLRAANPVPERPASRPIDEVLPGWGADAGRHDPHRAPVEPQAHGDQRPSRVRSRVLGAAFPAAAVLIAVAIALVALHAIHARPHVGGETTAPSATIHPPQQSEVAIRSCI